MTQTERVSALLRESAPLSVPEIVRREIDEFRTSERFHEMLSAARYFENRSDIEKKTNDVSPRLSQERGLLGGKVTLLSGGLPARGSTD